jgi:hypothetical protein
MKKDSFKTVVIFRQFKGEIIALFPYIKGTDRLCLSYMHIGQHGSANYPYIISDSQPCKETEYKPLFDELENIGYNLTVKQRASYKKMYL